MKIFTRKRQFVGGEEILAGDTKNSFRNRPVSSINSGHTNMYIYIYYNSVLIVYIYTLPYQNYSYSKNIPIENINIVNLFIMRIVLKIYAMLQF